MTNLDSTLKGRDITNKGPSSQSYGFSGSHVWMWEVDYKESWVLKNWYFWTGVLEKTLESPLDCKEIQPVHPKGNQSQIFIGRADAEAETPILWPPDAKNKQLKRPWCWESLKSGGEGDDQGWDGWMASLTQQTWVWVGSRSRWWTGNPGLLQSIGSQRVGHNWVTELKEAKHLYSKNYKTLMEATEDNTNWWKDIPCSWMGRIHIVKITILLSAIYRFNAIPIEILRHFPQN